jgi:hypothetical protein
MFSMFMNQYNLDCYHELWSEVRFWGPSGAITDYGVRRVIMLPDAILAAWRAWLVWCQISQTHSVLLMK